MLKLSVILVYFTIIFLRKIFLFIEFMLNIYIFLCLVYVYVLYVLVVSVNLSCVFGWNYHTMADRNLHRVEQRPRHHLTMENSQTTGWMLFPHCQTLHPSYLLMSPSSCPSSKSHYLTFTTASLPRSVPLIPSRHLPRPWFSDLGHNYFSWECYISLSSIA